MPFYPRLRQDLEKYHSNVVIVEGEKDVKALTHLGFDKVYPIHQNGVSIRERCEQIALDIQKKDRVSILTDFDRRGRKLHEIIKPIFHELGAHLDSSFRSLLAKTGVQHIEGLPSFISKNELVK